ncbi:MAG: hypothetical protein AAGB93_14550 [Planctomycetota bacterium]
MDRTLAAPTATFTALASLLASHAAAQITPVSQLRTLDVTAELGLGGGPFDSDSAAAPDLGPFVESATAFVMDSAQGLLADAGAWQNSSIVSDRLIARGGYNATAEGYFSEGRAINVCEFVFDITQRSRYELRGTVESFDVGDTRLTLVDAAGQVIFRAAPLGFSGVAEFDVVGVMEPSRYTLRAQGSANVLDGNPADYGSGSFDVDLAVEPLGSADCATLPNSSGAPAQLSVLDDHTVGSFDTTFVVANGPPNSVGILFYGPGQPPVAFGEGVLCVASPLLRVPGILSFDAAGLTGGGFDYFGAPMGSGPGQIFPGSTWTFQAWFRDVAAGGGATWNTSNGQTITFAP